MKQPSFNNRVFHGQRRPPLLPVALCMAAAVSQAGCPGKAPRPGAAPSLQLTSQQDRLAACAIQGTGLELGRRASRDLAEHLKGLAAALGQTGEAGAERSWSTAEPTAASLGLSGLRLDLGTGGASLEGMAEALDGVITLLERLNQGKGTAGQWRLDEARLGRSSRLRFRLRSGPELRSDSLLREVGEAEGRLAAQGEQRVLDGFCPRGAAAPEPPGGAGGAPAWRSLAPDTTAFYRRTGMSLTLEESLGRLAGKLAGEAPLPEGFTGASVLLGPGNVTVTLLWHQPLRPARAGAARDQLQGMQRREQGARVPGWARGAGGAAPSPFPRSDTGWDLSRVSALDPEELGKVEQQLGLWEQVTELRGGLQAMGELSAHRVSAGRLFGCLWRQIQSDWPFDSDGSIRPEVVAAARDAAAGSGAGTGPMLAMGGFDGRSVTFQLRPEDGRKAPALLAELGRCRAMTALQAPADREQAQLSGRAAVQGRASGFVLSEPPLKGDLTRVEPNSRARKLLLALEQTRSHLAQLQERRKDLEENLPDSGDLSGLLRAIHDEARMSKIRVDRVRTTAAPVYRGAATHHLSLELVLSGGRLDMILLVDSLFRQKRLLIPYSWRWEEYGKSRVGRLQMLVDVPFRPRGAGL